MLGRRHADGSSIFSVDRLVEGIIAFEDEAAAETFGEALEAEGHQVRADFDLLKVHTSALPDTKESSTSEGFMLLLPAAGNQGSGTEPG